MNFTPNRRDRSRSRAGSIPSRSIDWSREARAALRASDVARAGGKTFDLVGPEVLRDRELVERTAAALGRTVEIGAIPVALARFAAALRTRLAGPGFSPDAIDVITADTELPVGAAAELGVELSGVDEMIAASIKSQGDA